jgi:hypothetical protein
MLTRTRAARYPALLLRSQRLPEDHQMAGSPGLRQQQALRHVGPAHRSAAGRSEGDQEDPFPLQIATLHQRPDQPVGVPGTLDPYLAVQ